MGEKKSSNFFKNLTKTLLKKLFAVQENNNHSLPPLNKILIIRQHNQLGDLLAGVSLFRALKENYPNCQITLFVSPANEAAVRKNKFLDKVFVFDKKKIFSLKYLYDLFKILKEEYDAVIVPVVVSISFTSNLLARLSNSKIRIGPNSLDGKLNDYAFFFDRKVDIDWRKHPDSNVYERSLDILRPFGINTSEYSSEISFDNHDINVAKKFLSEINSDNKIIVGMHVGAGKIPNRWSCYKFAELIDLLSEKYSAVIYLTGSTADKEEIEFIENHSHTKLYKFINQSIPEIAALISLSDLFISNDTGIMHVAGTTKTPLISLFGPTNPFNWAPVGKEKHFVYKSELIDDIQVEDVYKLVEKILNKKNLKS